MQDRIKTAQYHAQIINNRLKYICKKTQSDCGFSFSFSGGSSLRGRTFNFEIPPHWRKKVLSDHPNPKKIVYLYHIPDLLQDIDNLFNQVR